MNDDKSIPLTKLRAAHRQLNAAIRLHFEDFDPVAVHTLAAASAQLFGDLIGRKFPDKAWEKHAAEANGLSMKDYFRVTRAPQNFLKHAESDPDSTLDFNPREAEHLMFIATLNAGPLDGISTSEQVFQMWYMAARPEMFPPDFEQVKDARTWLDGINEMSTADQKLLGARRLAKEARNSGAS